MMRSYRNHENEPDPVKALVTQYYEGLMRDLELMKEDLGQAQATVARLKKAIESKDACAKKFSDWFSRP